MSGTNVVGLVNVALGTTIGALEIGSIISAFMYGVITLQTHYYFRRFWDDRLYLKLMVVLLWCLEFVHTAFVAYEVYRATVTFYGRPEMLQGFPFLSATTVLGGTITFITHAFFCARLWRVLPHPWRYISPSVFVVAFVRFAGSIFLTTRALMTTSVVEYREKWHWLITSLLVVGACLDIIISGALLYYLATKRTTALTRSKSLIDHLLQYTLRSGLATSVGALTVVIVFQTMPDNLIWLAVYTCLAKLYSNSLLSVLNARADIRATMASSAEVDGVTSRGTRPHPSAQRRISQFAISVDVATTTHRDEEEIEKYNGSLHTPMELTPIKNQMVSMRDEEKSRNYP